MKSLEEIKKEFYNWSGFELEGTTKQELKDSIEEIKYKLECETSDKASSFDSLIDSLDIEEGC